MHRILCVTALLAGCGEPGEGSCEYPNAFQPVTETLESGDTCRAWELAVDQHLYVNVGVTVPEDNSFVECAANEAENVAAVSSPIYSNLADQGAKWTFDWVGATAGEAEELLVDCTDGTVWQAMVQVAE